MVLGRTNLNNFCSIRFLSTAYYCYYPQLTLINRLILKMLLEEITHMPENNPNYFW